MSLHSNHIHADQLLRFPLALELAGVSRTQAYVLLERGEFPVPVKIGRNSYFSRKELEAWIDEKLQARAAG